MAAVTGTAIVKLALTNGPFGVMSGAPWNVLDSRGCRIARCGSDSAEQYEKDGPPIAAAIVNALNATSPTCHGCGKPLAKENAWMEDGCPCNSPKGCNDGNQLISDWRQDRIQELQHEVERLKR